jgi:hypothetical protein
MLKPAALRAHLSTAVPQLARDPEKLIVVAKAGRVVCTGTGTLSFEYRYTLQIIALDYAGHSDALIVPLLAWVQRNQSEILDNPALRGQSIRFEVEYLTTDTVDLSIEVDLTERAIVRPRHGAQTGALQVIHPPEPPPLSCLPEPPAADGKKEHWALYMQGEPDPLAEWDFDPRPLL